MPSQQEVRWSQLKIGVIVLVAAVILTTLLFLMTSSSGLGLFSHKLTVTTYFENSAGLKEGAAVNLQGVTIGQVKSIAVTTAPDRKLTPVQVVMKLDSKYQNDLHTDSTAALTTVGVLGDTVVDINSQVATGPPLQDGATLNTLETPSIQDVVKQSQGTIENLNTILAKLNTVVDNLESGKGSFGQLLTNPELYNKFVDTMTDVQQTTAKLNNPDNTLGKFLNDKGQMYDKVDDALGRVDDMTKGIQAGKGTAGQAADRRPAVQQPEQVGREHECDSGRCAGGQGRAGRAAEGSEVCAEPERYDDAGEPDDGGHQPGQGNAGQVSRRRYGLQQPERAVDWRAPSW